eukprot:TRINITY_DN12416_c4_g6_i1.p1 TRINITY_DN12416_c4_g6~~TRINITY_DN12416_c4_g6_i1.p1  ORF type:complete len:452 (+),score=83.20 TRINITY_DN12416_c4_g6_i1:165-1520(+)
MVTCNLIITIGTVFFILFDIATDWNLYASIARDFNRLNDRVFLPAPEQLDCSCNCNDEDVCQSAITNTNLCNSLLSTLNVSEDLDLCDAYGVASLVSKNNGVCVYRWSSTGFEEHLDDLKQTRTVCLVINLLVLPFCILYMMHLLRRLRKNTTTDRDVEMQKRNQTAGNNQNTSNQPITQQPGPAQRFCANSHPIALNAKYCPQCGAQSWTPPENAESSTDGPSKAELATAQFKSFVRILHLRVGFLLLEDLPQLMVLMAYAVLMYKNDGLRCRRCVAEGGQPCEQTNGNSNTAIIVSLLGTAISILMLIIDVINKIRKVQGAADQVHLCFGNSIFMLLLIFGVIFAPSFYYMAASQLNEMLDMTPGQRTIVFIVATLFALPPSLFAFLGAVALLEWCGCDVSGCLCCLVLCCICPHGFCSCDDCCDCCCCDKSNNDGGGDDGCCDMCDCC